MPPKSKAQQRLMQAAEHGATFPMAEKVRSSMSLEEIGHFTGGSMKKKPEHVKAGHPHRNLGKYLHKKKAR